MSQTVGDYAALLQDNDFVTKLSARLGLEKADTVNQGTGLLWYDLRPVVLMLYPFQELIPCISKLPRVAYNGGNAFHWKRITSINSTNVSPGVSEGNRGARIAVAVQDQQATYKTLGLESSVTFEARLGSQNLNPEALGTAVQSTLRATMIAEEQILILGNSSTPLGTVGTVTLLASGSGGTIPTASPGLYVMCVALSGIGWLSYTSYNSVTGLGGVPAQINKVNADASVDIFGGGSSKPSAEASVNVTSGQVVTASVAVVNGAVAYAWYAGTTSGSETFVGITATNRVIITKVPAATNQPIGNLKVGGVYQDNSTNALLPDGILSQIFGSVFGGAPGTVMSTNPSLPTNITLTGGGSLVYTAPVGNTGLTIAGTNIAEFDVLLQAAYEQYKIGFDKVYMSSADISNFSGLMLASGNTSMFRIMFEANQETGRLIAGRRITSYLNKFFGNTLDIEIHPYMPPGTILFWSDRAPYELSGVPNILEAHVRQDYYQIQWPLATRRYEYGVYVDEVFACYFTPAFAVITNLNAPTGVPSF
jgi:hypothetical protein